MNMSCSLFFHRWSKNHLLRLLLSRWVQTHTRTPTREPEWIVMWRCQLSCVLGVRWRRRPAQEEVAHCGCLILRRKGDRRDQEDGGDRWLQSTSKKWRELEKLLLQVSMSVHVSSSACRCVGVGRARPRRERSWRSPRMLWWKCLSRSTNPSSPNPRSLRTRRRLRTGSGTRPSG